MIASNNCKCSGRGRATMHVGGFCVVCTMEYHEEILEAMQKSYFTLFQQVSEMATRLSALEEKS